MFCPNRYQTVIESDWSFAVVAIAANVSFPLSRYDTEGLQMYTVREQQELDFDRLHTTSMEWNEKTWFEQAKEGRFEGRITFHHKCIYWFENYASLILARDILIDFKEDYSEMFDTATEEWVLTSSYATEAWVN